MYFIVERTVRIKELVRVKADNKHEAFVKAGLDEDCKLIKDEEGDYEPDFGSIIPYNLLVNQEKE